MSRSAALLTTALTFSPTALAEEPAMDLSKIESILPTDQAELAAVMTLATSNVAALGLPLELSAGNEPGEIRFKGVPNDRMSTVIDAVNGTTPINGYGCVGFVTVPNTDQSPAEYTGPYEMGAACWKGAPMPPNK